MKKLIITTTILILLLAIAGPLILTLGIRYLPNERQPSLDKLRDVYGGLKISQEFISEKDSLVGIAMTIKNPNLENRKDITLTLFEGDKEIRSSTLNGQAIEDGSFVKFLFDEVEDSGGKPYSFVLSAPLAGQGDLLRVFVTESDREWLGKMKQNEGEINGSVSMVTLHKPESKMSLVLEIYGGWLKRLGEDRGFVVAYGILIVGLLALMII